MSQIHQLELRGCAPDPLMAYLKALGIFRIVAEQNDPQARAWWEHDTLLLCSTLDRETLVDFFLEEYRPSPIVSPWNNRYRTGVVKGDKTGLDVVLSSSDERLSEYRSTIAQTKQILEHESDKNQILARCRAELSDSAIEWFDATYVLISESPRYPPLTSNGGTLGTSSSGDISMNFVKNLVSALGLSGRQRRRSDATPQELIRATLFDDSSPHLPKAPGGQFQPRGWGPNASVGFDADSLLNPWDFVLMCEGILTFGGASARRLSAGSRSKAVFPFTVDTSAAGYGTAVSEEYSGKGRAEFWAPLWDRPATLREVTHVLAEGRAQLGRQQASHGTAFARAIAGLGTERGINSFQRFGFLQRTGRDAVFASPIGRFTVKARSESDVLFDLDQWVGRLQSSLGGSKPPAGLGSVLRRIDDAIIEFCHKGEPRDLQNVLIAVGHAERWLSKSGGRENARPLGSISRDWLEHAKDRSPEFRLARSLASILHEPKDGPRQVGPIRANLEPVETGPGVEWNESSKSFVWKAGDPLASLLAVVERRCLEGRMKGLPHPPLDSAWSSRLSDIVAFLNGDVDAQRVADLALPLSFIHYGHRRKVEESQQRDSFNAPFGLSTAYAAMKLTLLPRKFEGQEFSADIDIWPEPAMLALLRAGRVNDAYRAAYQRLKSSGLQPLSDDPGIPDRSDQGRRLAAALLFPLDDRANKALAQRALRPPTDR